MITEVFRATEDATDVVASWWGKRAGSTVTVEVIPSRRSDRLGPLVALDWSGEALVVDGVITNAAREFASAATVAGSRELWAWEAEPTRRAIFLATGVRVPDILDARLLDRTVTPESTRDVSDFCSSELEAVATSWGRATPDQVGFSLPAAAAALRLANSPEMVGLALARASATMAITMKNRAATDADGRVAFGAATVLRSESRTWGWLRTDGIRINADLLETAIDSLDDELSQIRSEYFSGRDLWSPAEDRWGWLAERGINLPLLNGKKSLKAAARADASVPESARADWNAFDRALQAVTLRNQLESVERHLRDGRVYPKHSEISSTGRMSLSEPALQSLAKSPIPGATSMRELVLAEEGRVLTSMDVRRAEPSVLASISGCGALQAAMREGDLYEKVGSRLGVPREQGKVTFLSLIYARQAASLATEFGITLAEAEKHRTEILGMFPTMQQWMKAMTDYARRGARLHTVSGRPLPFLSGADSRLAVNYLCQGSAADLQRLMLHQIRVWLERNGFVDRARIFLSIHDEVVVESTPELQPQVVELLKIAPQLVMEYVQVPLEGDEPVVMGGAWK